MPTQTLIKTWSGAHRVHENMTGALPSSGKSKIGK